jgi:hypothetical protein
VKELGLAPFFVNILENLIELILFDIQIVDHIGHLKKTLIDFEGLTPPFWFQFHENIACNISLKPLS